MGNNLEIGDRVEIWGWDRRGTVTRIWREPGAGWLVSVDVDRDEGDYLERYTERHVYICTGATAHISHIIPLEKDPVTGLERPVARGCCSC